MIKINILKTNELSFYNDFGILTLNAKQFDTGRIFVFNIIDNDEPFDLSGCEVYLRIDKADGTQFQGHECCTINDSTITVNTGVGNGDQILAAAGINKCELHLKDTDGTMLTTWTFNISVEKRVHNGENISSVNSYDVLDNMINMEKERIANEQIRVSNETERVQNEDQRILKENQRILDEAERQKNESERQKTFSIVLKEAKSHADNAEMSKNVAKESEDNAKASEEAAKASEESAAKSEDNAKASELAAAASEAIATQKAADATESEENAVNSAASAAADAATATDKALAASGSAASAAASEATATEKADEASDYATQSKSYAVGGTGTRENENADNASYYYEQIKNISQSLNGLIPMGTITFDDLSNEDNQKPGYFFNISDSFVSDERFVDGGGIFYGAGNNVLYTADGMWDVTASSMVSGVKGAAETEYRQGFVDITPENVGAVNKAGDTMSGKLYAFGGISLNQSTTESPERPEYLLGVDAYEEGGTIHYKNWVEVWVGNALNADWALQAEWAAVANHASYSDSADMAVQDMWGNVIDTTYFKISGGELEGELTFNNKLSVRSLDKSYVEAVYIMWQNQTALNDKNIMLGEAYVDRVNPRTNNFAKALNNAHSEVYSSTGKAISLLGTRSFLYLNASNELIIGTTTVSTVRAKPSGLRIVVFASGAEFHPDTDNYFDLGRSSSRWRNIYAVNGTIQTSDRNKKKDEKELDDKITVEFVMGTVPKTYKFIDGTSGRTHYGFIAQDIEELMNKLGMDSKDFAGFVKTPNTRTKEIINNDGTQEAEEEIIPKGEPGYGFTYSLRYEEFIPILYKFCQIMYEQMQGFERRLKKIEENLGV